jgi:hypothetical protein
MQKALVDFYGKVNSGSTAVFFFSGFGIQSDRHSYVMPTDSQVWNEGDVRRDGFVLDDILAEIARRGAKVQAVILDASRRNPFEHRFRSVSAGLAPLSVPRGSAVISSELPDAVAETSPPIFMSNLLAKLKGSDTPIEQIFNNTRMDVSRLTNGAQVPWVSSSLDADVPLGRLPGAAIAAAPAAPAAQPTPPPSPAAPPPPPPSAPAAAATPPAAPAPAAAPPPAAPAPEPAPVVTAPAPQPAPPAPPPPSAPVVASAPAVAPPPPPVTAAPPVAPAADPQAAARHDYVLAEDAGTKEAWENFIAQHPSGYYFEMAKQQLAKVTPSPPPARPAPPVAAPSAAAPPAPKTANAADEDSPTDLPGFYRRGQRRAVAGDFQLAIADFSEVIHRDPKHAGALNDRCWVRALVGELQDALKDCNAALAVAPSYPDALDSRGLVNLKLGQYPKAIQDYNAALALDEKHASALYGRGIAKRHIGDAAGAKADIEAAKSVQSTIVDEFAGYGIQ